MNLLEKNIQALLSGVNEPLGNKLLNFIQNKTCSRFNIDENLNIFDKTHNVFMYENLELLIFFIILKHIVRQKLFGRVILHRLVFFLPQEEKFEIF